MNREEWIVAYQYGLMENRFYRPIESNGHRFPQPVNNGYYTARAHGKWLSREEVEQWINQQN